MKKGKNWIFLIHVQIICTEWVFQMYVSRSILSFLHIRAELGIKFSICKFSENEDNGNFPYSMRCCILSCRFWQACFSCRSLVAAFRALRICKTRSSSCISCWSEEYLPSSTSTFLSSSLRSQDIEWGGCRQKKLKMLTVGVYHALEQSISTVTVQVHEDK